MDLGGIVVFTRVVQAGSFTRAARDLSLPKSTVSRRISELEARLGARLLQRTTRRLNLTDAGRAYFEHCARIVAEAEAAEREVQSLDETPRGLIRVTTPLEFPSLPPLFARFLQIHPEVQLDVVSTDRLVDLVGEGFDLAVRAGPLRDSTLVVRPLTRGSLHLVATPGYLDRHGRPRRPADLARHAGVVFSGGSARTWRLQGRRGHAAVTTRPVMVANTFEAVSAAALAGLGIAMLPSFICDEHIAAGRFEVVLPRWNAPTTALSLVYPSTRHLSTKVRALVDFLLSGLSAPSGPPSAS